VRAAAQRVPGGMTQGVDVATLDVVALMRDAGLARDTWRNGGMAVECPWSAEHSGPSGETAAMVWPAGERGELPGFKCMHAHCAHRGIGDLMRLFAPQLGAYAKPAERPHHAIEAAERRKARLAARRNAA